MVFNHFFFLMERQHLLLKNNYFYDLPLFLLNHTWETMGIVALTVYESNILPYEDIWVPLILIISKKQRKHLLQMIDSHSTFEFKKRVPHLRDHFLQIPFDGCLLMNLIVFWFFFTFYWAYINLKQTKEC